MLFDISVVTPIYGGFEIYYTMWVGAKWVIGLINMIQINYYITQLVVIYYIIFNYVSE